MGPAKPKTRDKRPNRGSNEQKTYTIGQETTSHGLRVCKSACHNVKEQPNRQQAVCRECERIRDRIAAPEYRRKLFGVIDHVKHSHQLCRYSESHQSSDRSYCSEKKDYIYIVFHTLGSHIERFLYFVDCLLRNEGPSQNPIPTGHLRHNESIVTFLMIGTN